MGCSPSSPTREEQQFFVEGKSPFFIKETLQTFEKTPGGGQKKVKRSRKRFVPRLKSINESNILTKRNKTLSTISTTMSSDQMQSSAISCKSLSSFEPGENKSSMLAQIYE